MTSHPVFRPKPPYIVVEPLDVQVGSSIVVAEEYKDASCRGIVHTVWDDTVVLHDQQPQLFVGPGDEILYAKYGAIETGLTDAPDLVLLHHEDIYCVLEDAETE